MTIEIETETETATEHSAPIPRTSAPQIADAPSAFGVMNRLRMRLQAAVRGREQAVELIVIALLADGHVLLEDYPGSGKTTLSHSLGEAIIDDQPEDHIVSFRRI